MFSSWSCHKTHLVRSLWAIASIICLQMPIAVAQLSSTGLGDLDLWAANFLEADEPALPATTWSASDSDILLALTRNAQTRRLSPAEQLLMRRLVLSASDAPANEKADTLLAERARLMFQIGEASAAAQILPSLKAAPAGLQTDEIAIDLQLAIGQTEAACLNGAGADKEGAFWISLRAACFALEDNFEQAELALELANETDGIDGWLRRAIFAASGDLQTKPEARFDSGLSLAISAKAGLEPSINTIANSRLDLAAAIARQDTFDPSMRVQAAGVAAEAGLLSAEEHRALYKALVESPKFSPRTPLEVAMQAAFRRPQETAAKARMIRAALRTARGNAARFGAVSRLLYTDLKTVPPSEAQKRMAFDFALAGIAAGDYELATGWAKLSEDQNAFQAAWAHGLIALAREDEDKSELDTIAQALLAGSRSVAQKDMTARLFTLWYATGRSLPPKARAFLSTARSSASRPEQRASQYTLTAIAAASREGAAAELILQTVSLTSGSANEMTTADISELVRALMQLGETKAARMLATEATGYFRTNR